MQKNKKYIIFIDIGNSGTLRYEAIIENIDSYFVTFIDKYNKRHSFNLSKIISYQELKE